MPETVTTPLAAIADLVAAINTDCGTPLTPTTVTHAAELIDHELGNLAHHVANGHHLPAGDAVVAQLHQRYLTDLARSGLHLSEYRAYQAMSLYATLVTDESDAQHARAVAFAGQILPRMTEAWVNQNFLASLRRGANENQLEGAK